MAKLPVKPKKILVVRHRFIGDTVLTVPFLRNLHYEYPQAQIDVLVEKMAGSFLKHCPYINHLINFENIEVPREKQVPKWKNLLNHINLLRAENYDMAFILKRSFSSAMLCAFAGIPKRISFDTEHRGFMLTCKTPYDLTKHESECFLDLLRASDIPVKDNYLEAWTGEEEAKHIHNLLKDNINPAQKKVLINASASNPNKMWSVASYARTIEELVNSFNVQVFFIGTRKDEQTYETILQALPKELKTFPVNLIGKTNVLESTELLKHMDLVIGVDSGILHLSAAVNTPTIAIFGPMNDKKWAPLGDANTIITAPVACRPCNLHKKCENCMICMSNISHRDVIAIAAKYLKTKAPL
jgi:heptosyltransferase-2